MATDVLLMKNLNRLEAAEPVTSEILKAMKQGEVVTGTIRRARNPRHHAKMFALLNAVFESQNRYPSLYALLTAVKIWTGHYESLMVDGKEVIVPKSISFANMPQDQFESFYNHVVNVILEKILPGIDKSDLERRIDEILNSNIATGRNDE